MAQSGQKIWLSDGVGELRIYLGVPPREAKGKRIAALRFADELRSWIADGVGANHAVWFEIYDWLGRALPQPPAPRDIVRMADELVEAFEQGRLVALQEGATIRYAESPNTVHEAAPPAWMSPPVDDNAAREQEVTWIRVVLFDPFGYPAATSYCRRSPRDVPRPAGAHLRPRRHRRGTRGPLARPESVEPWQGHSERRWLVPHQARRRDLPDK